MGTIQFLSFVRRMTKTFGIHVIFNHSGCGSNTVVGIEGVSVRTDWLLI
jgi:hypothetical protein